MSEELPQVTLARIEGKLDLINAGLISAHAKSDDHEIRLRSLEARVVDPARISALEDRPIGITPTKFLTTLVGCGSLAAALASVVTLLSR